MKAVRDKAIAVSKGYVSGYLDTHPCVDCGEADKVVLDFDHVRGDKVCEVSVMVGRGYRLWKIIEEIEKCEVRCANCHRRVTVKRRKEQALIV